MSTESSPAYVESEAVDGGRNGAENGGWESCREGVARGKASQLSSGQGRRSAALLSKSRPIQHADVTERARRKDFGSFYHTEVLSV